MATDLTYGTGFVHVFKRWPAFITTVENKRLPLQCESRVAQHGVDFVSQYDIFTVDGQIVYQTRIFNPTIPTSCEWSQADNDTWRNEFEASYLAQSNVPITPRNASGSPVVVLPSAVPSTISNTVRTRLKDGSNESLISNGSSTAKTYQVGADTMKNIRLYALRFTLVAQAIKFDGTKFAKSNGLTNGLKFEVVLGGITTEIARLKINEDFFELTSPNVMLNFDGSTDVLVATFDFEGSVVLAAGTSDAVRVTVQDNLTTSQLAIDHFKAFLIGAKE